MDREDTKEEIDELAGEERAQLLRWQPPGPPADFAARVLDEPTVEDSTSSAKPAAVVATTSSPRPAPAAPAAASPSRARAIAWGTGALALAASAALALSLRSSGAPDKAARPTVQATFAPLRWISTRESLELGGRGIAVAEAGAALAWRRTGASARVEQEAGDVFYRVDPGGPFTVTTAAGEVRVTGTCFRVEVISMKPSKQGWIGAAAGAALATAVVVTVYEGKVVVASPSGNAQVRAGERATLTPDAPPALATSATPTPTVALAELPPAPPNATREELLARDEAMRQQVASLAQRVRQLQTVAIAAPPGGTKMLSIDGKENWMDVSPEQLRDFARECRVQLDYPALERGIAPTLDPKIGNELSLSAEEVAVVNQSFAELQTSWASRVRALYLETTGDAAAADSLSVHAMTEELREKGTTDAEADALQKRLAEERAGILPVPTDLSRTSPYERYFRALAGLGDETEALIAAKLGDKTKARAIRAQPGGWPQRRSMAGCREGAKGSE